MKPTHTPSNQTESAQTARPNRKDTLLRATVLTAAIAIGATTLLLSVSPTARAFAMHGGGSDGDSFIAQMHGGGHSHADMHAHFDKVMTEAGIDDARKQQIHGIMKDAMDAEHADMKSFHDSCSQLKTLLTAETIDDAAIAQVRAEQDRLALATSHRLSDTMVAVAKVLTPAQRAKLGAEIDKMMASHDMHHHDG
jgi:Spy/CpxP family protein refolding chaperone